MTIQRITQSFYSIGALSLLCCVSVFSDARAEHQQANKQIGSQPQRMRFSAPNSLYNRRLNQLATHANANSQFVLPNGPRVISSRSQEPFRPFAPNDVHLSVTAHVERRGDVYGHSTPQQPVWIGTTRQSRQIEGFQIDVEGIPPDDIEYMAHLSRRGDTYFVPGGYFVGTRGESRAVEGFAIRLRGRSARLYDVVYRAHLSSFGDTDWYRNGEFVGTRGKSRPVEAMQIVIVPKGRPF